MSDTDATTCYRHDDRRAGVVCQRCDRPICPSCMHQASVGFHCPECTRSGSQRVVRGPGTGFDPLVTKGLVGLNALGLLWAVVIGGSLTRIGFDALVDGGLFAFGVVREDGAVTALGVDEGEWWRLLSAAFLHDGLLHIALNMAVLWLLGGQLERILGRWRYGSVYLVGLLGGSFGVLLVAPTTPTVGASGAVFGLMGVALVVQRAAGINPWASGVGGLIVVNLLITFTVPRISIGGHVGGLLGGVVAGLLVTEAIRRGWSERRTVVLLGGLALAFAAGGIWAATLWRDPIF